jgi:hypothetical protein
VNGFVVIAPCPRRHPQPDAVLLKSHRGFVVEASLRLGPALAARRFTRLWTVDLVTSGGGGRAESHRRGGLGGSALVRRLRKKNYQLKADTACSTSAYYLQRATTSASNELARAGACPDGTAAPAAHPGKGGGGQRQRVRHCLLARRKWMLPPRAIHPST